MAPAERTERSAAVPSFGRSRKSVLISEQRGRAAGVDEDDGVGGFEVAFANEADEAGQALARVHRVEQQALVLGRQRDGFNHLRRYLSITRSDIRIIDGDPVAIEARRGVEDGR